MKRQKQYYKTCIIGILAIAILSLPDRASAQVELHLSPGYMFSGMISSHNGKIDIKDNVDYTAALTYQTGWRSLIELSYTIQGANVVIEEFGRFDRKENIDLRIEYYMISLLKEPFSNKARVRPFGGFSVGLAAFSPQEEEYNNLYRPALGLNGGVRISITEKLGFRMAGRLLFPVTINGAALWCSGGGCDIGAGSTAYLMQADVQAGLVYHFGK